MQLDLQQLIRPHLLQLSVKKSKQDITRDPSMTLLDANENSFGSPLIKWYNRYPDPYLLDLKQKIASIKNVKPENMLLTQGTGEGIDLLLRLFCEPSLDNIVLFPPCYTAYTERAAINHVNLVTIPLTTNFQLDLPALEEVIDVHTKILFFCSPNNPTGNLLHRDDLEMVLNNFDGIVVIDEAYINYSRQRSFLSQLDDYPNLVVLQSFSQAWGLAGLQAAVLFASPSIIEYLEMIQLPYPVNSPTVELLQKALSQLEDVNEMIRQTVKERQELTEILKNLDGVEQVYPSEANFLLVKFKNAPATFEHLLSKNILVKNLHHQPGCENCLRLTIGTPSQNQTLITALSSQPSKPL